MSAPRVFLVDDHPLVRAGVRSELGDRDDIVGEAPGAPAATTCVSAEPFESSTRSPTGTSATAVIATST